MAKGKFANGKSMNLKPVVALLAMVMLLSTLVGGTLAWLTDTDSETNTFTVGNIDIELTETPAEYKMIPGVEIDKDPVVTVLNGSEDCWVFVQVEETIGEIQKSETENYTFDDFIAYSIDTNNWMELKGVENVYYCKATNITKDRPIKVLGAGSFTDNMGTDAETDDVTVTWGSQQVATKPSVTKQMMDAIVRANAATTADKSYSPKLIFNAYAIQAAGFDTAAAAWTSLNAQLNH